MMTEVKYIEFSRPRPSESGKTRIWRVLADAHIEMSYSIGEIKWHGAWRRYAFYPAPDTYFEQDCLRKIATFCEVKTKKLRQKWKTVRDARHQ